MLKLIPTALAALMLAGPAAAHEVWLERDGSGPARVYLGEPVEPVPAAGDPEFPKLKAPTVFTADPARPAALTRRANHIEAAVTGEGDVRLVDASVFEPWAGEGETKEAAIYYARAGRSETRTALDLEIAPVEPGGDVFVVLYKGAPVADAAVTLINPERWSKTFRTDASGRFAAPVEWSGRYILGVTRETAEPQSVGGVAVAKVYHISTLTFVKP